MAQYNVTTDGAHLQNALVAPTNTDPSMSLGNLTARGLQTVTNLAALRTWPRYGPPVYVEGHTTRGDTGGGVFIFDSSIAQTRMVSAVTISAGGTGYSENTLLTVSGGSPVSSRSARVLITAVSAGVVTTVSLIDNGNYTVDPSTSASATTCVDGTGCTLNLTMAKFDNSGTLIAPTSVAAGMWVRETNSKEMNVRWFGARGLYSGNEKQNIQNAINAAGPDGVVTINAGRYICGNTLYLENGMTFKGHSPNPSGSLLWASNTTVPLIKVNDEIASGAKSKVQIKDICIGGNSGPYSIKMYAVTETLVENVTFTSAVTADNIYMSNCWGSRISNCRFYGSSYSHIHLARPSGHAGNHAVVIDRLYVSSSAEYGILVDSDTGAVGGVGVQIRDCTVQGLDIAAVALISVNGATVSGLYTEDGPRPIILGDRATSKRTDNVAIFGCTFMTYGTSPMLLSYCYNVAISGCDLDVNGVHTQCLHYDQVRNVHISGCNPSDIHAKIRRLPTATNGLNISIGENANEGASVTMRATGGADHLHYKMSLNSSGAWVATEWTPTSL